MNTAEILNKLFLKLNEKNIPFLVLRNYEDYPEKIGQDVDVLVRPESMNEIDNILLSIADDFNVSVVRPVSNNKFKQTFRFIFSLNESKSIKGFKLDFLFKIDEFGVEYINANSTFKTRKKRGNFYVLDEEKEFFHILIHGMFHTTSRKHKERYCKRLKRFLIEGRNIPKKLIMNSFFNYVATSIITDLKSGYVDNVFFNNTTKKKIAYFIKNDIFFIRLFDKLKRIIKRSHRKGLFVVLLGPDGSGKSTIAGIATKLIKECGITVNHSHSGFRPAFLPARDSFRMGVLKRKRKESSQLSVKIMDFLRYCYHFIDYLINYFLKIRPKVKRGNLVISERYFYDYILAFERKK